MQEREIALFVLMDIFAEGAYNNIVLRKTLREHNELNGMQKAFVTELVNGTLRNLIQIDYIIGQFSKTPVKKLKPFILNNLRIGIYQLLYMDKIPNSAVCNEAVKLAKKRGFASLSGFVNGVLRNIARNKEDIEYPNESTESVKYLAVRYSYEEWMIKYWLEDHTYDEVKAMCIANSQPPQLSICVNTLKTDRQKLKEILEVEGMTVSCDTLLPNSLYITKTQDLGSSEAFKQGLFHIMDESSMLAVYLLGAKSGDRVIDVCAAPGGKSCAIAENMNNKGIVVAGDCYEHKVKLISENAERLGIDIIEARLRDALNEYDDNELYDCVLVDAPCSGLGLVKKKPDIKYNKSLEDITELAQLQMQIAKKAARLVKKGGYLVYSTCTISKRENLDNVERIKAELGLEEVKLELPEGISCDTAEKGYIELLPGKYNTDGFFIALFRRK